jgi:hypothetical protein
MGVAMANIEERHFEIVSAATVILDRKSKRDIIIIINQAAYMPGTHQFESLLHTDQARNYHLVVNDIAACYFDRYDNAKEENLGEWISICRTFGIQKHSSEPYCQHQNKVERRIQQNFGIMHVNILLNLSTIPLLDG